MKDSVSKVGIAEIFPLFAAANSAPKNSGLNPTLLLGHVIMLKSVLCMCVQSLLLLQVTQIGKKFGYGNMKSSGILKVYLIFEVEPCDDLLLFNGKKLLWWLCDFVEYELQNDSVWNS